MTQTTGPLSPYRVLDLSTRRGWMCGKVLADLGAHVIKIEPPGGDPARLQPPFHGDVPDPERNLRWWFQNRGKRSVTLDLQTEDGRVLLRRLAATAHVLVESFDPGQLDSLGVGYDDLRHTNASLVYTSITPFGQAGPHARFEGPDLILGAAGGQVWLTGDPDRPPVRITVPQYELHGAVEAAVHTTIALYHAASTGRGQHVDVASQLSVIRTLMNASSFPYLEGREVTRTGGARASAFGIRMIYECSDGHIAMLLGGGPGIRALLAWAGEDGDLPPDLKAVDWEEMDFVETVRTEEGKELFGRVGTFLDEFFRSRTKDDVYEGALKRRLLIAPCNTVADIRSDAQLEFRNYFTDVSHDELGTVTYPGPWAKLSATPIVDTPRAPRTGEHTDAVLGGELGLSTAELRSLRSAGVI